MNEHLRTCSTCGESKELHNFSLRSTITKQRHHICKMCHKQAARAHYLANKDKAKDQARSWSARNPEKRKAVARKSASKRQKANKQVAVDYKGGKCTDCGGVFPLCCYDFHHLDPNQKDLHLSIALTAKGFDFCKEELDKCVLLCANCHRIRHNVVS